MWKKALPGLEIILINRRKTLTDADMDINNFRVNPDYRNSFLEEYIGPIDGNSSGRFLHAIEHLVQNGNVSILAKEL